MLLGMGSAVTLIHKRLLNKVDRGRGMFEAKERVISAIGQPLGILGVCKIRKRLRNIDANHDGLVASDISQDCFIGVDFFATYYCLIDFENSLVKAGSKVVSLGIRREEGGTCGTGWT